MNFLHDIENIWDFQPSSSKLYTMNVGPDDFPRCGNTDRIAESSQKKGGIYCYNAECHDICQILDE